MNKDHIWSETHKWAFSGFIDAHPHVVSIWSLNKDEMEKPLQVSNDELGSALTNHHTSIIPVDAEYFQYHSAQSSLEKCYLGFLIFSQKKILSCYSSKVSKNCLSSANPCPWCLQFRICLSLWKHATGHAWQSNDGQSSITVCSPLKYFLLFIIQISAGMSVNGKNRVKLFHFSKLNPSLAPLCSFSWTKIIVKILQQSKIIESVQLS